MHGCSTGVCNHRKRFERLTNSGCARSLVAGAIVVCGLLAERVARADACSDLASEPAIVAAVGPRGELKLTDDRIVRLAGFDPAEATPDAPELGETVRSALVARIAGKPVRLHLTAPKPDRWGRLAALVWPSVENPTAGGVAAEALAIGLGRYLPEPDAHVCRAALIQAEAAARQSKLGLWADPYYGVLAVDDHAGFAERTGTIVLTEGTVAEVQPGSFRTTLRFASIAPKSGFASRGVHMLVVTILPGVMKRFRAQQFDVSGLVGRHIRVRGLLDTRFGPRIELNDPDDIESLEPPASRSPK